MIDPASRESGGPLPDATTPAVVGAGGLAPSEANVDAWIERMLAAIREDREVMRETMRRDPRARFSPPF